MKTGGSSALYLPIALAVALVFTTGQTQLALFVAAISAMAALILATLTDIAGDRGPASRPARRIALVTATIRRAIDLIEQKEQTDERSGPRCSAGRTGRP